MAKFGFLRGLVFSGVGGLQGGDTLLLAAIQSDRLRFARSLITECEADVNEASGVVCGLGVFEFGVCCSPGDHRGRWMLQDGMTALLAACKAGYVDFARWLHVSCGGDVKAVGKV